MPDNLPIPAVNSNLFIITGRKSEFYRLQDETFSLNVKIGQNSNCDEMLRLHKEKLYKERKRLRK